MGDSTTDGSNGVSRRVCLSAIQNSALPLVVGHLLRWSILAFEAPGRMAYDILCIHPDLDLAVQPVRLRVRCIPWAEGWTGDVLLGEGQWQYFDYLVLAGLNLCRRDGQLCTAEGRSGPEFHTLPAALLQAHYEPDEEESTRGRLRLEDIDLGLYKNEQGWNFIAGDLGLLNSVLAATLQDEEYDGATESV